MRRIYGMSLGVLAISLGFLWMLSPGAPPAAATSEAALDIADPELETELQALGLQDHNVWIGDVLWSYVPQFHWPANSLKGSHPSLPSSLADSPSTLPSPSPTATAAKQAAPLAPPPEPEPIRLASLTIGKDGTFYEGLQKYGFAGKEILDIVKVAKPHRNLGRIRRGTEIHLVWNQAVALKPDTVRIPDGALNYLEVSRDGEGWTAEPKEIATTTVYENYAGEVVSTLWGSARKSGMNPVLIQDLADIFGWQVDFAREVMVGDRWRLTVAKSMVDDKVIDWGPIVAAQYENAGVVFTAVRYAKDGLKEDYYQPDGRSLKSMFLRSPLRFARITSKFSMARFHPVLKVRRPHYGVDYAAPTGTPIRAVGAGKIVDRRYRKTSGKFIKIRHNATYHTAYKHLSRYAKGIKKGARVEQGQVIGYVGSTGLATGPHLHFEFYERGRVIDPLGRKFPSSDPLPQDMIPAFKEVAATAISELPPWSDEEEKQASSFPSLEDKAYGSE